MIQRTPCDCPQAGYCARHKTEKSRLQWLMCQRSFELFHRWEQRAADPSAKAMSPAPLPRCQHRGQEALEQADCELCGNLHVQVPIYTCEIHARCSERRFGNSTEQSRKTAACTTCDDYLPFDASVRHHD